MKKIFFISLLFTAATVAACGSDGPDNPAPTQRPAVSEIWEFDNADGWVFFHQDTATIEQWDVADGMLRLTTRAGTYDRTKMHTADYDYTDGTYSWRTYVPAIAEGDRVSVGSWIYSDDHHELDFEVGSGTAEVRRSMQASPGQLVACMTSQDHPFKSGYALISPGWHDFELRLELTPDDTYTAVWSIDGVEKQRVSLDYGPETGFGIQCSVENLRFIGDRIAQSDYTGLFDRVAFSGHRK